MSFCRVIAAAGLVVAAVAAAEVASAVELVDLVVLQEEQLAAPVVPEELPVAALVRQQVASDRPHLPLAAPEQLVACHLPMAQMAMSDLAVRSRLAGCRAVAAV